MNNSWWSFLLVCSAVSGGRWNSMRNHQRPSSMDVKVLSERSSWGWFLVTVFQFCFLKDMVARLSLHGANARGGSSSSLLLWLSSSYLSQRNRPPTQLRFLKGSCMPRGDFGEGLIGVGWTPHSGCLIWLKYSVIGSIGSIGEVCSPTPSLPFRATKPFVMFVHASHWWNMSGPFGCFHGNTFPCSEEFTMAVITSLSS